MHMVPHALIYRAGERRSFGKISSPSENEKLISAFNFAEFLEIKIIRL
eukprot:SAG11_NODE_1786_length_4258_cov_1.965617_5_plen_48_part_00